MKKHGEGSHNWGGEQDDIHDALEEHRLEQEWHLRVTHDTDPTLAATEEEEERMYHFYRTHPTIGLTDGDASADIPSGTSPASA